MSITKNALVGAIVAAALVPASAQADAPVSASAVVKATVRADANLDRAHELADSTRRSARARATKLHQRSRAQINRAADMTRVLVRQARETGETAAAMEATMRLTAALDADAKGQVSISAAAKGKLQSSAMKALAADAALELQATLDMATLADETKDDAAVIDALAKQMTGQVADVATDLRAATSRKLSAAAQAAADLAVATDTKANAVYTDVLTRLHGTTEDTVKPALQRIAHDVAEQAARIRSDVEGSMAAPHTVSMAGAADVTLAGLAIASGEASAHGAMSLSAEHGSARGSVQGGVDLSIIFG